MAEEQREQNQGFFSRVIDGANSGYNKYRGGRMAVNVGKQVGKKTLTGAAEATSEFWIPAVIFGLAVVVIIFVLFGGVSGVKGGDLTNSPSPSGSNNASPSASILPNSINCSSGNYVDCLKQNFNVVVNGTTSQNNVKTIFDILSYAAQSSKYKDLLTNGGVLTINVSSCTGCASTGGPNTIGLRGFFNSGLDIYAQRYLLIHESGHTIWHRNGDIKMKFTFSTLVSSDGASCYDQRPAQCSRPTSNWVKTYALRYICPSFAGNTCIGSIEDKGESFAEAIADYAVYRNHSYNGNCSVRLSNFSSQCSNTYRWVKDNIYGGFEF